MKNILLLFSFLSLLVSCTNPSSPAKEDNPSEQIPEHIKDILGTEWVSVSSEYCFWFLEVTESAISSSFVVDDGTDEPDSIESSCEIPDENTFQVKLLTDETRTYTFSFSNINTMILDDSVKTYTFQRVLQAPADLDVSSWSNPYVAELFVNVYGDNSVAFAYGDTSNEYGYTMLEGWITDIQGSSITVLDSRAAEKYTLNYSKSGNKITVTMNGKSFTMEYIKPFPSSMIGTTWTGNYGDIDFELNIISEYKYFWYSDSVSQSYNCNGMLYEIWPEANVIILDELSILNTDGGTDYDVDVYLDLSNLSSKIVCSYEIPESNETVSFDLFKE